MKDRNDRPEVSVWVPIETMPNAVPGTGRFCCCGVIGMAIFWVLGMIYNAVTGAKGDYLFLGVLFGGFLMIVSFFILPDD